MPKPSPSEGTTTIAASSIASPDRRDEAEEANRLLEAELAGVGLERRLERPAPGDVERGARDDGPRLRECAQEDEVALDRDQPPDAEQARLAARVRRRGVARRDPVVDDLEVLLVEALRLGEVAREALRDRDVHVRERADRAVGERRTSAPRGTR